MTDVTTDVPICSVAHICAADVLEQVKQAAFDFLQLNVPNNTYALDGMLPTLLSPTGTMPATFYMCYMPAVTVLLFNEMISYRDANNVPSQLYQTISQEDFLASQNLQVIGD